MTLYSTVEEEGLHMGTAYWIKYIKQRIEQNKDFICPIIGKTGSGKSYAALKIMELLNGKINKENYFFKASDFLRRACSEEGNKPGTVLLWDEIGVGLNAKQWQSKINKTMGPVFQTIRHNNLIILVTLPYLSFLDVDLRRLIQGIFETKGIDHKNKICTLKPTLVQVNQVSGKMYTKYLRVSVGGEGATPIERIQLPLANEQDLKDYEDQSRIYKNSIKESALKTILSAEEASMKPQVGF